MALLIRLHFHLCQPVSPGIDSHINQIYYILYSISSIHQGTKVVNKHFEQLKITTGRQYEEKFTSKGCVHVEEGGAPESSTSPVPAGAYCHAE